MTLLDDEKMNVYIKCIKELEKYDTPTVSNAVATYPSDKECLALYEPHKTSWYMDERIKCLYPELGARCGFAVTCVYGMPGSGFSEKLGFADILKAIEESPKPVILAMKQNMPKKYARKNAMIGGNMMTAFSRLGVRGVIGDGPARDKSEMERLGIQAMFTGLTAGHGLMNIEAVNIPVSLCSMDIAPMEIIHMDENGSVKFPAKYLPEVLEKVKKIAERDAKRQKMMKESSNSEEIAAIMKGIYK